MLSKDLEAGYGIPGGTYDRDKGNTFKDIIGSANKKYLKIPGYTQGYHKFNLGRL